MVDVVVADVFVLVSFSQLVIGNGRRRRWRVCRVGLEVLLDIGGSEYVRRNGSKDGLIGRWDTCTGSLNTYSRILISFR